MPGRLLAGLRHRAQPIKTSLITEHLRPFLLSLLQSTALPGLYSSDTEQTQPHDTTLTEALTWRLEVGCVFG